MVKSRKSQKRSKKHNATTPLRKSINARNPNFINDEISVKNHENVGGKRQSSHALRILQRLKLFLKSLWKLKNSFKFDSVSDEKPIIEPSKKERLRVVFVGYMLVVLFFAVIYQQIYIKSPKAFSFNEDIQNSQLGEHIGLLKREIKERNLNQEYIDLLISPLIAELKGGAKPNIKTDDFLKTTINSATLSTKKFIYTFTQQYKTRKDETVFSGIRIDIADQSGNIRHTIEPDNINMIHMELGNDKLFENIAKQVYESNIDKVKLYEAEIMEASKKNMPANLWNYLDFLYFSTITITTVGYGDMLPNDTTVRMLVVIEIFMGLFLLAYGVNLISFDEGKARSAK